MGSTRTDYVSGTQEHEILGGFAGYIANKIDLSANNSVASDVIQAIKVGAGMLVTAVSVIVDTAEGGTLTATVGDGDGANSWDASTNLNATAGTVTRSLPGTDAYATAGKYYSAADTIDLTMSANAGDTAIFWVIAEYVRITT